MLVADRHRLRLVFQDFYAQAVRCLDKGLTRVVVVARQHCDTGRLPLGDLLLDVVDDEADMVHNRPAGAALAFFGSKIQINVDAGEHHQRVFSGHEQLAAHAEEDLFVGLHVLRGKVPVTHGHAGLVEWGRLRGRGARGQRRAQQ